MANNKKKKYDEGAIKGKMVYLIGAAPVLVLLIFAVVIALVMNNFAQKMSVNKDDSVCGTVRQKYASSIDSSWPCDITDQGDHFLVTFNESANTNDVPTLMSFNYNKTTKQVEPAITLEK